MYELVPKAGLEPARLAPHAPKRACLPFHHFGTEAAEKGFHRRVHVARILNVSAKCPLRILARCGPGGSHFEQPQGSEFQKRQREWHYRSRLKSLSIKGLFGKIGLLSLAN